VISGDIKERVVVENDVGYEPILAPGTGTILAIVCHQLATRSSMGRARALPSSLIAEVRH